MPVFTFPLALFALLAIPALVAIYWLRNRSREQRVSSLVLWLDQRQVWDGGQRIHRLQLPLLFFLELLAILLLTLAAAGPMLRAGDSGRPLVIVLDDSFSMLAGDADSARVRAIAAIENELRSNRYEPIRFVLAGEKPQMLGDALTDRNEAIALLQQWRCGAQESQLEQAVAFAFETGGARARVLAVTDHAPEQNIENSRLQWWAFGTSRNNAAFVNAARTARDGQDHVLLEISNLAASASSVLLKLESLASPASSSQKAELSAPNTLSLAARETRRIVLKLKENAPAIRATLSDDALRVDNEIILLPETKAPVRTELRVTSPALRAPVEKVLQSFTEASLTSINPQLLITDEADLKTEPQQTGSERWTVQLLAEASAGSFLGPFVMDRAHPLTEGISLNGTVWGSGKSELLAGKAIITAGNVPLLTDIERADSHELRLRWRPDLSTLQETPNWPILWLNLINWRAAQLPGFRQANVRLGSEAMLTIASGIESVALTDPQKQSRNLSVREKSVTIRADLAGVYEITAGQSKYAFAANALNQKESDLTQAASGRWGNWANADALQWEYRSVAWALLLLALVVLAIHAWLMSRNVTGRSMKAKT